MQQYRSNNQEIDFDILIAKLLEIPNEELLDSILNLSAQKIAADSGGLSSDNED